MTMKTQQTNHETGTQGGTETEDQDTYYLFLQTYVREYILYSKESMKEQSVVYGEGITMAQNIMT